MAESKGKQAKPETPKEAVKATDSADEAEAFPVERLTSEPGFLPKYEPYVVAGALATVDRKALTLAEAEAAVETWLKSEVEEA